VTPTDQPSYDAVVIVCSVGPDAAVHLDPASARCAVRGPDRTHHDHAVSALETAASAA